MEEQEEEKSNLEICDICYKQYSPYNKNMITLRNIATNRSILFTSICEICSYEIVKSIDRLKKKGEERILKNIKNIRTPQL